MGIVPLELEELELVPELEELPVPGVAVGVAAEELLELEELLVPGVAVGVVVAVAELLELEELLVPGVAVAELLLDVPLLEVVPPVTGTPAPATLLVLLTLLLKPMLTSFSRRPRIVCSHEARLPWAEPNCVLLLAVLELLFDEFLLVVLVPPVLTMDSACPNAKAY